MFLFVLGVCRKSQRFPACGRDSQLQEIDFDALLAKGNLVAKVRLESPYREITIGVAIPQSHFHGIANYHYTQKDYQINFKTISAQ